jgi:hypothetical protein
VTIVLEHGEYTDCRGVVHPWQRFVIAGKRRVVDEEINALIRRQIGKTFDLLRVIIVPSHIQGAASLIRSSPDFRKTDAKNTRSRRITPHMSITGADFRRTSDCGSVFGTLQRSEPGLKIGKTH